MPPFAMFYGNEPNEYPVIRGRKDTEHTRKEGDYSGSVRGKDGDEFKVHQRHRTGQEESYPVT